jgi:hypothetical protein
MGGPVCWQDDFGDKDISQFLMMLVPSSKQELHDKISIPFDQALPTPDIGTPSPCNDSGMHLDSHPSFNLTGWSTIAG